MTSKLKPIRVRHDARTPGVTYQLEYVLCGKAKCRKLHGPYWYAYWRTSAYGIGADGKMRKRYIGKKWHPVDRAAPPSSSPSSRGLPKTAIAGSSRLPKAQKAGGSYQFAAPLAVFTVARKLTFAEVLPIARKNGRGISEHWLYEPKTGRLEFVPAFDDADPEGGAVSLSPKRRKDRAK